MTKLKQYFDTARDYPRAIYRSGDVYFDITYRFSTYGKDDHAYVRIRTGDALSCSRGVRCAVRCTGFGWKVPWPHDWDPDGAFGDFLADVKSHLAEAVL